ncbi:S-adenosyl-L-methionine-dependent methyltransferase [Imleria badia]|nr:S-adenosyl-L-methionine-dependent methyltransferase [Imleria badia]
MFPPSRPLGRERGPDAGGAIRQTDPDVALARLSAVKKGYIEDPFIKHLIHRAQFQPARPPGLINIGTYAPSPSTRSLTNARSDTRFWRVSTGPRSQALGSYFQLDFPDVVTKKAVAICKRKQLSAVLGSPENIILASGGTPLHLINCELRHPPSSSLVPVPDGLLSSSLPTLLLSNSSSALIDWFMNYSASPHDGGILGAAVYEMFSLQDAFSQVMNVSLRGTAPYLTIVSLPERFTRNGLMFSSALTLSEVREKYISPSELERISHLELLDEVEELNLVLKTMPSPGVPRLSCLGIEITWTTPSDIS